MDALVRVYDESIIIYLLNIGQYYEGKDLSYLKGVRVLVNPPL